ncbi:MAG: thioesterase family protein [Myxococcaceae bacterium]
MAFERRIQIRFDEVDFARVVYYPRFFNYAHQVFEDFFAQEVGFTYAKMLQERKVGYPSVHCEADFRRPLRFGDVARIVMETVEVGTRSISCRYRFYVGDSTELCAELKVVCAGIEMDTFKGQPIPDDVKRAFEKHKVTG